MEEVFQKCMCSKRGDENYSHENHHAPWWLLCHWHHYRSTVGYNQRCYLPFTRRRKRLFSPNHDQSQPAGLLNDMWSCQRHETRDGESISNLHKVGPAHAQSYLLKNGVRPRSQEVGGEYCSMGEWRQQWGVRPLEIFIDCRRSANMVYLILFSELNSALHLSLLKTILKRVSFWIEGIVNWLQIVNSY